MTSSDGSHFLTGCFGSTHCPIGLGASISENLSRYDASISQLARMLQLEYKAAKIKGLSTTVAIDSREHLLAFCGHHLLGGNKNYVLDQFESPLQHMLSLIWLAEHLLL